MTMEVEIIPGDWTALVVEDEPIIAFDLETRLIRLGATRVEVARDEAEATELLRGFCPTVAVVDWFLRRSTASDLITALAAQAIEIVVLTGAHRTTIELPAGADVPVVSKPVADPLLASIVAAAVARRSPRAAGVRS